MSTLLDRFNPNGTREKRASDCRVLGCYNRATSLHGRCARCEEEIEALKAYGERLKADYRRRRYMDTIAVTIGVLATAFGIYVLALIVLGLGQGQ